MGNKQVGDKQLLRVIENPTREKEVRKLFSSYDHDGSKVLDRFEFMAFAKAFLGQIDLSHVFSSSLNHINSIILFFIHLILILWFSLK